MLDDSFCSYCLDNDSYISEEMVNDSYYGNYTDYFDNNHSSVAGEIALWRAVLLQAFIDLKVKSNNKKYRCSRRKAFEWFKLQKNKEDLKEVCRLAGYEYRKVKQVADEIIEQNRAKK